MPRAGDAPVPFERLLELASQADRQGRCRFTPFLTPPEAALAEAAARRVGVGCALCGGYEGAERRMARFCPAPVEAEPFPLTAVRVTWPHQSAPAHRDLLGALMGLGIRRDRTGDIVLGAQEATLFVEAPLTDTVLSGLAEAGRARLTAERAEAAELPKAPQGEEMRFTVQSARLDAVVADGFHLSRGDAAALVEAGAVKLRHVPTLRPDARVAEGDAISVRGYGRLMIESIGAPTRKGRLPVALTRYGAPR
jgi:RNA-binding protein YlmH